MKRNEGEKNWLGREHHVTDKFLNEETATAEEMKEIRFLYNKALRGDGASMHELLQSISENSYDRGHNAAIPCAF